MKNFRLKNILLSFAILLAFCSILFMPTVGEIEKVSSHASYTRITTENVEGSSSQSAMVSPDGDIPFSLYTSLLKDKNKKIYDIVDYHPTFTASTQNQGASAINYYSINPESIPYILLSSFNGNSEEVPEKDKPIFEKLYNTTLYFKFNDQDFKGNSVDDNTIPTQAGYMDVTADVNGTQISVPINTSNATTDDASLEFAVNLKDINDATSDVHCPTLLDDTLLGGNTNNDVSFRTGLYSFQIRYSYKDSVSNVSNECIFEFSFYLLDYYSYVEDSDPLAFDNTNTFYYDKEGVSTPSNYEIFNYNYANSPIVWTDATKFALNFVYTTGYTNYAMNYDSFAYSLNCTPDKVFSNASIGSVTGSITLKLKDSDLTYTVYTYMQYAKDKNGNTLYNDINSNKILDAGEEIVIPYYAKFDLKDFETNFLVANKTNTTYMGQYSFDLGFLVQTNTGYSVFSNDKFDNYQAEINNQKLILFGYNLKYYDQNASSSTYGQNVELKNNVTHTNFIAFNTATSAPTAVMGVDTGTLKNIPEYIAVTNQAPLRFDYYGNLTNYSAKFYTVDYKDPNAYKDILDSFNAINSLSNLENNLDTKLTSTYTQGASISNDGIRIMKLEYSLNVDIEGAKTIQGVQYVVFEINNTVENLYIKAVDNNTSGKITKIYDFKDYTNKNVIVTIENKPNTFFAPFDVSYNYYSSYNTTGAYTTGKLALKQVANNSSNKEILTLSDTNYNYYVTSNSNSFTFTNSGVYRVCIKNSITNTPSYYYFAIDKENFNGVTINKASLNEAKTNYTLDEALSASLLSTTSKYVNTDLFVTNSAFTLGWSEKNSGAESFSYVYYMDIDKDTNLVGTMLKSTNLEYWITNGSLISSPSSAINTFKNYKSRVFATDADGVLDKTLDQSEYFTKDGIYIFYIYDEAGNFFTRTVLLDTSKSTILQGKWVDANGKTVYKEDGSTWVNTYDTQNNPSNYVDEDTTLYFGTHKALKLPTLTDGSGNVSFEDISFTREYAFVNDNNFEVQESKTPISFDIYNDILKTFKTYVKSSTNTSVLIGSQIDDTYYLTVENRVVSYSKDYETGTDETGSAITGTSTGTLSDLKSATIYKIQNPADNYNFYGEAYYKFDVENSNGAKLTNQDRDEGSITARIIAMNFDKIQGTFKAYGDSEGNLTEHEIRKNSGTNLDVLNFEYNSLSGDMATYYSVASLTFDYYAFVLDDSSQNSSKTSYPFASTISSTGDLLIGKVEQGEKIRINSINIDASGKTMPGKYILTRTYVGGTHNLVNGEYVYVGTGGSYVPQYDEGGNQLYGQDGKPKFENLFEFDTLVRKYTVYVDHNGIITTSYMVRDDATENIREVGDNISITLSNTYDDEWNFKEFFLTSSSTLALETNKVPVKINIPLSKYFVYFYSNSNNQYAKQSFANLEISITYFASANSPAVYYTIDGFDPSTGLCTCSKLVSSSNPFGQLIFSSSGNYTIEINDRTGYTDATSSDKDADNKYPTTYSYSFTISHTAPEANAYSNTFFMQEDEFELKKLTNEDNSNNFATNIKQVNSEDGSIDNNQVILSWADPLTPYQAKVNQVDIKVVDQNNRILKTISIDLKQYQDSFETVATSENKLITSLTNYEEYILYFKVVPYRELSSSFDLKENYELEESEKDDSKDTLNISTYDHTQYYRYSYIVGLDISNEYKYQITLSYISDSTTNQAYNDENGQSFATSLYNVTIDRTKPNTNIDNLLKEESYLVSSNYYNSDSLSNFKEENFDVNSLLEFTPSSFTYAFGVSDNFALNYNPTDTATYFYVRTYQKFDNEYSSITPDMIDSVYNSSKAYYTDFTKFSVNYPRFAEITTNPNIISIGDNRWYKINYQTGTALKQQIADATSTTPSGFYEIIEKDTAGNYRSYTIYYNQYSSLYQNLEIDGYTQKDNIIYLISNSDNAQSDNINAGVFFETTNLTTTLGWGTLTVANATTSVNYDQEIIITPFDNYDSIATRLNSLNTFLDCELSSKFTLKLKKYNSTYTENSLTRHINLMVDGEGKLSAPTIEKIIGESNKVSYNLILPVYDSKSVLYLEDFTLQILSNSSTWTILPQYSFEGKENVKAKLEGLTKGVYKAIYKDNFNDNSYSYILYVGEEYITDFNKAYSFEFDSYYSASKEIAPGKTETVYYSGGYIDVTYEAKIYKVYLVANDGAEILISGTNLETDSTTLQNCKTFRLSPSLLYSGLDAENTVGGLDTFTLIYVDITDNSIVQKTVNFSIFNALPQIYLTNAYGNKITSTLQESDSDIAQSIVTISWDELKGYDSYIDDANLTQLVATLYTRNENGEYKNGVRINKEQLVTEEGYYKLTLGNRILGNFREIYFAISFSDVPLYTIKENDTKLSASNYEKFDITKSNAVKNANTNKIIEVIYDSIINDISDIPLQEKNILCEQLGTFSGGQLTSTISSICNLTNIKHFYTTGSATISYNSNIELNILEFVFKNDTLELAYLVDSKSESGMGTKNNTPANVGSDYWTTIFLLYNLDGPIKVEFFALTKVPKTSALVNTLSYKNEKTDKVFSINLKTSPITTTLTNAEIINSDITLYWNALPSSETTKWYNAGNVIILQDTYGVATTADTLDCSVNTNNSTQLTTTLAGSGLHKLVFKDLAGNIHEFASTSYSPQKYYSILLIDSVIYNIKYQENDINAIQYGVFNESLSIVLNSEYLTYYSSLSIVATRNGNSYTGFEVNENIYTFTTPGRYTVTLSALYGEQKIALNNAVYNFTILSSNSARLAYEFVEISGYEILEVTRNGQNITSIFDKDDGVEDGRVLALFVSSTAGGNGYYSVKLKYGTKSTDVLQFNFTINDYIPTISSNVGHGETTQGSIVISYNPSVIYEQLGECYIKVLTYNNDSKTFYNYATITINEDSFTDTNAKSFEITRSNSYFIQVETKNGNVISSFRVNKTDPLNTMAIIIIVIAVIATVVLTIVIVKLRTKMKIK